MDEPARVVLRQAGMFSVASEDVLKNRAIKKAKRRNMGGEVKPDVSDINSSVKY